MTSTRSARNDADASRARQARRRATWLSVALALLASAAIAAGDEAKEPPRSTERSYVVGRTTLNWKLDASRLPAASRERAARMAEAFSDLVAGRVDAKDRRDEEIEVKVLADGTKRARVPAYLINAALLRYGTDTDSALVCTDGPQGPAGLFFDLPALSSRPEGQ